MKLLIPLFMLFALETYANVNITVSVPIHSEHNNLVMLNAKTKAAQMSLDKLPSVIWGEQSMRNSQFSETIKAIGFSHAHVDVLSETWDHQAKQLTISAYVTWDEQKVRNTLKSVQEGEQAKRTVAQIETILNGISARDFLNNTAHRKFDEARLLASPFHFGMDMNAYVKRYNETLAEMIMLRKQRVVHYIDLIVTTPKGMRNQKLHYTIEYPDPQFLKLSFESPDLQRFYDDNKETIEANYRICAVSTSGRSWLIEERDLKQKHISVEPIPALLSGIVEPTYHILCK